MSERAVAFLDETDCVNPLQSSFQPGFGTETTLVTLVEDDLTRDCESLLILLELSGAFDTIKHGVYCVC